jgi:myo-inositol-1(or 4)-monophosphatase
VDNFATHADIEAENAMRAVLHRERPADAILGEESGRSGARSSRRTWLLDPLCGILNYAVRMRVAAVVVKRGSRCQIELFSIQLALWKPERAKRTTVMPR